MTLLKQPKYLFLLRYPLEARTQWYQ